MQSGAFYDISNFGESYALSSLVNDDFLEVDVGYVESYVDSQHDNPHQPIGDNPPVEDGVWVQCPRGSLKDLTFMALK